MMLEKIVGAILPWVATIITAFPWTDFSSRLLDRLIILSERQKDDIPF